MPLFGRNKELIPEVEYPLPAPVPGHALALPIERYRERYAHAFGELGVLVTDYGTASNAALALAQSEPPGSKRLVKETDARFVWLSNRYANWTETFQAQFQGLIPPSGSLADLHAETARWMVANRDCYYYTMAQKMYLARQDFRQVMATDYRIGVVQDSGVFPLSGLILWRLNYLASTEPELFDSLQIPEMVYFMLYTNHAAAVAQGHEPVAFHPEIVSRYPDAMEFYRGVEEMRGEAEL